MLLVEDTTLALQLKRILMTKYTMKLSTLYIIHGCRRQASSTYHSFCLMSCLSVEEVQAVGGLPMLGNT